LLIAAGPAPAAYAASADAVTMPGPSYRILRSGPTDGRHPSRADKVAIRYVGKLANGEIFSTSADQGRGTTSFAVRLVIPGFSALVQLMRPGDRWIFSIPAYLAYGEVGKKYLPGDATMKRDVPPGSPLSFDVELVAVEPGD
jgi:FKBP-type peptidyl-prolyl cis-trans isomerase